MIRTSSEVHVRLLTLIVSASLSATTMASNINNCPQTAMTQMEMNRYAGNERRAADDELNKVYKEIQRIYADDPGFLEKLKDAQLAWERSRDAELAMMYPPRDEESDYYGSSIGMCESMYLAELTLARVAVLKKWLKGVPEGDVCSGTIKSSGYIHMLPANN